MIIYIYFFIYTKSNIFFFSIFAIYALETIKEIIAITIKIGNAMYISPNKTIPINTIGSSTTVKSILAIPHTALIPKKNSFPKTHSKHILNTIVNFSSIHMR